MMRCLTSTSGAGASSHSTSRARRRMVIDFPRGVSMVQEAVRADGGARRAGVSGGGD
jgi:hypothetical protein